MVQEDLEGDGTDKIDQDWRWLITPALWMMGDLGYPWISSVTTCHHCTKIKEVTSEVAMSSNLKLTLCLTCGKVDLNFNVSTDDEVRQWCLQSLHLTSSNQP